MPRTTEDRGYSKLLFEQEDSVLKVMINIPDKRNALDMEVRPQILEVLQDLQTDSSVRAVILSGAGKHFCAGGDLRSMQNIGGPVPAYDRLKNGHRLVRAMVELPKPIITSVDGVAAGAGVSLILASDLCIASDRAKFLFSFIKVGLAPDWGQYFFLPQRIGMARTKQLMMEGGSLTAQEAFDAGMINRIAPHEELEEQTWEWAHSLAQGATKAQALIKAALNCWPMNLSAYLELEANLQAVALNSDDHQEGRDAFLEKRKPNFQGK
ncbi:MAG: enoyl-CoA hydratase/isomerase family protein [Desulfarculus sp.]|nr:enoyl-CoA hydratase/isomerase family protein [Pseudomonadota bacterium]MBV1716388.1 enoyl-CoA hydratase/isomerase family protein [Desulfarculus sp.]MBU4576171.1 enoyl-CoA hydratase/isomerase family protein [Pseudomonadota bacterium]MBU4598537.1 enoyl-CoA hydratase/isomerase family protein [Pseudomonadota bacterium]MBV1736872.1 enoyl-CoA hydratase/isomerase family protein [Desulfarculus sp.]